MIIYAKSWSSTKHYGDKVADEELSTGNWMDWCVDDSWFSTTARRLSLHALPAGPAGRGRRRTEVLDGPRGAW